VRGEGGVPERLRRKSTGIVRGLAGQFKARAGCWLCEGWADLDGSRVSFDAGRREQFALENPHGCAFLVVASHLARLSRLDPFRTPQ